MSLQLRTFRNYPCLPFSKGEARPAAPYPDPLSPHSVGPVHLELNAFLARHDSQCTQKPGDKLVYVCFGPEVWGGRGHGTTHRGIERPAPGHQGRAHFGDDAYPSEPRTHLAGPLARERRGARRSGNSPVWILGLFHTFSPIKSRTRHMTIKEKLSVPPPQTTRRRLSHFYLRASPTSGAGPHRPWAYPIGREAANLGSEPPLPAVIGPFGRLCKPTDLSVRSGLPKGRQ